MREGSRDYFYRKLDEHFPGVKQEYIRAFGDSYECLSPNNAALMEIFRDECRRHGMLHRTGEVLGFAREFETKTGQMSLFGTD